MGERLRIPGFVLLFKLKWAYAAVGGADLAADGFGWAAESWYLVNQTVTVLQQKHKFVAKSICVNKLR